MIKTVLDVECVMQWLDSGKKDGSPFNGLNDLVSVGFKSWNTALVDQNLYVDGYVFFHHNEGPTPYGKERIQKILDRTELLIGHNLKFDLMWLWASGFKYDGACYDTMNGEYILARGLKLKLNLESSCIRRKVTQKKGDIVKGYLDKKIGYEAMPRSVVEEYGRGDVQSTYELYLAQLALYELPRNAGLKPTLQMANELLIFLAEVETNGIYINLNALAAVERDYLAEKAQLVTDINRIVAMVMGDTPININAPAQLSQVIYSRSVNDRHEWVRTFNIGTDEHGKDLRRPRMSPKDLTSAIRKNTSILRRTVANQCVVCGGTGRVDKYTKSGAMFKNRPKCQVCGGVGICYVPSAKVAGLCLGPRNIHDLTANGFSTDKETFEYLASLPGVSEQAKTLLTKLVRLNAVETYLSSFVGGIRRATRANKILHTTLNQCITATGRLSSSDPNYQNQPRGATFPVRRVVRSRWKNGLIAEVDFSQLEFRGAAALSACLVMLAEIVSGVDVHAYTSKVLTDAGQPTSRQAAKPRTFRPLYGGVSGTPAEVAYNKAFMAKYNGLRSWHERLLDSACTSHIIRLPSGREYHFPEAIRQRSGWVTGATQIKNYPVQGFCTADIVPIACINLRHLFRLHRVKSLIINTVHDSLVVDVYPGELDKVTDLMIQACMDVLPELKRRYNYDFTVPIGVELKAGPNWLNMKVYKEKDMVHEHRNNL